MKKLMHGSLSFCSDKSRSAKIGIQNKDNPSDVSFGGEEILESNSYSQSQEN